MQIIFVFLAILVFFFVLYRLGRDDYVFIRKNISMEQLFDMALGGIIVGVFFSRFLFLSFYSLERTQVFLKFFSPTMGTISLVSFFVGAWLCTYLVGKYKRYPLARIFDLFCLAFLVCLPVGFWGNLFFLKQRAFLLFAVLGAVYFILAIIFGKFLYPRLMNGKFREGVLSTSFVLVFSVISLFVSAITESKVKVLFFKPEDLFLIGVSFLSIILLFRQDKKGGKKKA